MWAWQDNFDRSSRQEGGSSFCCGPAWEFVNQSDQLVEFTFGKWAPRLGLISFLDMSGDLFIRHMNLVAGKSPVSMWTSNMNAITNGSPASMASKYPSGRQLLVNVVVSMGRRNTQLEPALH